ncbi:DUF2341 domain-containing protein [Haliangium sp.]|uniref:DUF2341 domain-containing protein n=1 Tax=Haliangium sp. TaxID=2663208 RepID=UPI003D0A5559
MSRSRTWYLSIAVLVAAGCGRLGYDPAGTDPAVDAGVPPDPPDASDVTSPPDATPAPDAYLDPNRWWNVAWPSRHKLIIDTTELTEKLYDVPVLVYLDDTRVDFNAIDAAGADLRFVAADGATELDYSLAMWEPTLASVVWVRLPIVEPDQENYIWMYYGNPTAVTSENPSRVWKNNYAGVWHLDEITDGADRADQTAVGNTLSDPSAGVSADFGVVGASAYFHQQEQDLPLTRTDDTQQFLDMDSAFTLEAWVNGERSDRDMPIINKRSDPSDISYELRRKTGGVLELVVSFDCDTIVSVAGTSLVDDGRWHYVAGVYDGGALNLYFDGRPEAALELDPAVVDLPLCNSTAPFDIGGCTTTSALFEGGVDEVRVSKVARSPAWLKFQYLATIDQVLDYGATEVLLE